MLHVWVFVYMFMAYDFCFFLSIHCRAADLLRLSAPRLKIYVRVRFLWCFLLYVCRFILCLSVSVDECVLEADYTRRNVYICAIKLVN